MIQPNVFIGHSKVQVQNVSQNIYLRIVLLTYFPNRKRKNEVRYLDQGKNQPTNQPKPFKLNESILF